jgi:hypothetical protein
MTPCSLVYRWIILIVEAEKTSRRMSEGRGDDERQNIIGTATNIEVNG